MGCWSESLEHIEMILPLCRPNFNLRSLRHEHVRNKCEICAQLLNELRIGGKHDFLMNLVRASCIDHLHFELIPRQEFFRRIDVASGVSLVHEMPVFL